jgi:hypothetical protein
MRRGFFRKKERKDREIGSWGDRELKRWGEKI